VTLLLGVDVGTSSSKGVLVTDAGEVVARSERAHEVSMPRPGWFEHDPEVWWNEIAQITAELLEGRAHDLAGVCFSGMGPCTALVDANGHQVRPAILYGVDTRAAAEIDELNERLGADSILAGCGSPLTSQSVGPKLRWVQAHEPESWERSRRLLMPSTLAVLRTTGEYVLDHHSASQCQPLYDLRAGRWVGERAELIAPGLELPRLVWPAEHVGAVTAAAARETGIPEGTPVAAGTIDAWSEAVSVGLSAPGEMMVMYGSTMFLIALTADGRPDARLWLTRWAFPETNSRAAGLATAGSITQWFGRLASATVAALTDEVTSVAPGADGLVALPYFAGERTPLFDPDARGALIGLHLGHTRAHLYRAFLESTAFAVRHNVEAMSEAGDAIESIVAVGGGTNAAVWMQIVSDVTGLPQAIPRETIGAAYGDAMLAGIAAGIFTGPPPWNPAVRRVEPNAAAADVYAELYPLYRRLYCETAGIAHRLARLQTGEPSRG